jgi:hypothetical protein
MNAGVQGGGKTAYAIVDSKERFYFNNSLKDLLSVKMEARFAV